MQVMVHSDNTIIKHPAQNLVPGVLLWAKIGIIVLRW